MNSELKDTIIALFYVIFLIFMVIIGVNTSIIMLEKVGNNTREISFIVIMTNIYLISLPILLFKFRDIIKWLWNKTKR